jgi:pilus assembly protein CpaC
MFNFRPCRAGFGLPLYAALALALVASPSRAQTLELPSIVHKVTQTHDRVDMVVNTSRHLVMDKKIPQAQVSNPEIVAVTPLSANKIQIAAKKPGVTQVNLWDEDNQVYTVDVVVFADAQELTLLLKSQFPKAALQVIPLANSVLITGYVDNPDEITKITEIAQDYHPKVLNQVRVGGVQQILLYVRVMEVSRTDLRQLGIDWAVFGGNSIIASGVSGLIQAASSQTQTIAASGGQTLALGVFQGASRIDGLLQALRQNDLLKIVAEPNLVCVSGRPAFFNVGGEFPILVPQSLGTVSIQYKKFGTQLDFVPIVLGNNRIRLEVRPRVSEVDPTRSVTINGTTVPGLRVREVETGVEMRAGETLAIAGLVQQRTEAQKRGLPWLSDIPYAGAIFRVTREQVQEIETLIMVTPQFVEAMECHEVPPGGPGLATCSPNHCQLWCQGRIEVPCNGEGSAGGNCPNCQESGDNLFQGGGGMSMGAGTMEGGAALPPGATIIDEHELIGPAPGRPTPAEPIPPPQAVPPAPTPPPPSAAARRPAETRPFATDQLKPFPASPAGNLAPTAAPRVLPASSRRQPLGAQQTGPAIAGVASSRPAQPPQAPRRPAAESEVRFKPHAVPGGPQQTSRRPQSPSNPPGLIGPSGAAADN